MHTPDFFFAKMTAITMTTSAMISIMQMLVAAMETGKNMLFASVGIWVAGRVGEEQVLPNRKIC